MSDDGGGAPAAATATADWGEWSEPDESDATRSLFSDALLPSPEAALAHDVAHHGFDLVAMRAAVGGRATRGVGRNGAGAARCSPAVARPSSCRAWRCRLPAAPPVHFEPRCPRDPRSILPPATPGSTPNDDHTPPPTSLRWTTTTPSASSTTSGQRSQQAATRGPRSPLRPRGARPRRAPRHGQGTATWRPCWRTTPCWAMTLTITRRRRGARRAGSRGAKGRGAWSCSWVPACAARQRAQAPVPAPPPGSRWGPACRWQAAQAQPCEVHRCAPCTQVGGGRCGRRGAGGVVRSGRRRRRRWQRQRRCGRQRRPQLFDRRWRRAR